AALTVFERELNRERTHAVLVAARKRGRKSGRHAVLTEDELLTATKVYAQQDLENTHLGDDVSIRGASNYRAIRMDADRGLLGVVNPDRPRRGTRLAHRPTVECSLSTCRNSRVGPSRAIEAGSPNPS